LSPLSITYTANGKSYCPSGSTKKRKQAKKCKRKQKGVGKSNCGVAEEPRDATQFAKVRDNERYSLKKRKGFDKSEEKRNSNRGAK